MRYRRAGDFVANIARVLHGDEHATIDSNDDVFTTALHEDGLPRHHPRRVADRDLNVGTNERLSEVGGERRVARIASVALRPLRPLRPGRSRTALESLGAG